MHVYRAEIAAPQECPIKKWKCIHDSQSPCEHFRGMMLLSGGYYGVVCGAEGDRNGSSDSERGGEGLRETEARAVSNGPDPD